MLLNKISYKNNNDPNKRWGYENLELQNVNLVVGYNATGKTRTLKSVRILVDLISGNIKLKSASGEFKIELLDIEDKYEYCLAYKNGIIEKEVLKINSKKYIQRTSNEEGWIYSTKLDSRLEFSISKNELAILAKRDKIQHPFLEKLISWANNTIFYAFGSTLGKNSLAIIKINESEINFNDGDSVSTLFKNTKAVVGILKASIEKHGKVLIDKIKNQMSELEYFIEDIGVDAMPNFPISLTELEEVPSAIWVKEKDLAGKTFQDEMSQGMFRALSLIIQTNVCILEGNSDLFIIDDIGEGLDHNRATKLIQAIIENAEGSNIQLLMATNDRYVMNNIDLKYWQIIQRKNGSCEFYNYKTSKEIFDTFEFTGLSNFDFLSTQFFLGDVE